MQTPAGAKYVFRSFGLVFVEIYQSNHLVEVPVKNIQLILFSSKCIIFLIITTYLIFSAANEYKLCLYKLKDS